MEFSLIRVMPSVSIGNPCALLTVHDVRFMINILLYLVSLVISFSSHCIYSQKCGYIFASC